MIDQALKMGRESPSFEERVGLLAGELELAIKWQRACLLLVVCGSEDIRTDVAAALENYLEDLGQKAVSLIIRNQNSDEIVPFFREFINTSETVFFIDGLCPRGPQAMSTYTSLNLQREFFTERQVRVILWLTQTELVDLTRSAPDFWSFRQRVIEFVETPEPERSIQRELDSAWHSIREDDLQIEESHAQATRPVFQGPADPDAESSTYARRLLTLGILNWRKGDYEKADEELREVLKIAAKIQDNCFEAECFNAVALVKTSMKRIDEAIEAYKQAILLAPSQIYAWNNLGLLCARIGRNDEAIVTFQKAIESNPRDPIGWNGLGNVYFRIGYMEEACDAFKRSIEYMPTFANPWTGLGDVFASGGRTDEAIKAYRRAIALNKLYVIPWLRLGNLFARQDQFREAIRSYQRALTLDPANSQTWNELGSIQMKCLAYDEAAEAFTKAIGLDPKAGRALSNLAFTYTQLGKYADALPLYLKSIEFSEAGKEKAFACNRLADYYRLVNEYDNAIAAYRVADVLDPAASNPRTHPAPRGSETRNPEVEADTPREIESPAQAESLPNSRMQAHAASGADLEARDGETIREPAMMDAPYWIFNPAPLINSVELCQPSEETSQPAESQPQVIPLNREMPRQEGAAMSKMTSTELKKKAIAQAELAQELEGAKAESTNAYVWNEKGNVHFKQGELEDAIIAYNKAIQLEPSFGWPYSNLALAYLTQNQYTEAILLYQKSIDLLDSVYDKAVSWNGLGNVYRCINDYPNAIAAYQKAGELDPETSGMREGADNFQVGQNPRSAQVWGDLGELFFKTGAYDEAIHAFDKAIELEPDAGNPYSNLAYAMVTRGQYSEAIPLYQKSIDLLVDDKEKAVVWNRLGNAYRKINDYEKAIQAYQQAVLLADEGVSLLTRTRFSLLSNVDVSR